MQALCVRSRAEGVGVAGGLDRILGGAVGLLQRKGGSTRNGNGSPGLQEGELGRASTVSAKNAQGRSHVHTTLSAEWCAHHS
jgi:hypothetical protein